MQSALRWLTTWVFVCLEVLDLLLSNLLLVVVVVLAFADPTPSPLLRGVWGAGVGVGVLVCLLYACRNDVKPVYFTHIHLQWLFQGFLFVCPGVTQSG